ncbi:TadE/TadG family type IV pilus assembly protein [Rhodopseudomonas sp. B29]|uniref:TadE/TadG family type IV pilus assembly protein n=1 Tax=Rhodopseudomonas sp. B29 TaxID=95607 RepID=UPI00034B3458|nr:TadE/TadG family type IV pilus assembly protein [Rhodopseudomonas sp. B29]
MSVLALARRFARNNRATTAVEFALVAPVFFGLLFAIMEIALLFFAGQVLETGVQDSARLILTGQAQNGSFTKDQFKTDLCNRVSLMFKCDGLYVDVESYSSFSNVAITSPIVNKTFVDTTQYNPGNAGDIVVVRAFYQWPLYVTGLGLNIANLSGSKRLLTATAAFRNEPY